MARRRGTEVYFPDHVLESLKEIADFRGLGVSPLVVQIVIDRLFEDKEIIKMIEELDRGKRENKKS